MDKVQIIAEARNATQEMGDIAHLIAFEIHLAWAEKVTELAKFGRKGYQVAIGSPHDW
jgi:hypothetical protein